MTVTMDTMNMYLKRKYIEKHPSPLKTYVNTENKRELRRNSKQDPRNLGFYDIFILCSLPSIWA
jgi:hypothetical protein